MKLPGVTPKLRRNHREKWAWQLVAVVAAGLPVSGVNAALAGGRAEFDRHQRGTARGIEFGRDVDEPAGVGSGRRLHERAAAGGCERRR